MDIKKELKSFKEKFDPELEKFFDAHIEDLAKESEMVADILRHAKKITMSGGKRLRPAFMLQGFLAAGGNKNDERIMKAVTSVELYHSFLLVHDDIIDRDGMRHGIDTVHKKYAQLGRIFKVGGEAEHFGSSIAIIAGDMLYAMGNSALFECGFDADKILNALINMQKVVNRTIAGEAQDVFIEYKGKATEEEILSVYVNKTAKYTVEGPLQTGAMLAGASQKMLDDLSRISIPLGVAFQIQDDILGVFGKEEKVGKPVGSDIEEGKQTILIVKALENSNVEQKRFIKENLGRKDLSEKEIEDFKNILIETKSLEYAKSLAMKHIEEGKIEIEKAEIGVEAKDFLRGIADYMANRDL